MANKPQGSDKRAETAELSSTNQRRKTVWQQSAKRLLQAEMTLRGFTYKQLARVLDGDENEQSLMTRINRGTFSFAFYLQVVRAMGADTITISHLPKGTPPSNPTDIKR